MNADLFKQELAAWAKDVQEEAIRAFDTGCVSEQCINIGVTYANARAATRALSRQALTGVQSVVIPGKRH